MSLEYDTPLGKLRKVERRNRSDVGWMWECPQCKVWGGLVDAQLEGCVSINCAADGRCSYHETHDFRPALRAAGASV